MSETNPVILGQPVGYYELDFESEFQASWRRGSVVHCRDNGRTYTVSEDGTLKRLLDIGSAGSQGPPGADGDDGAAGEAGAQGIQGPPGSNGSAGAQGIQGIPGNDGAAGAQGQQGIQGIQGPPGADGGDGSYAPGSFTIITGKYRVMSRRLQLTGTQRLTLQGTARLRIT